MSVYDDIEREGRTLFPEEYARDQELQEIVRRHRLSRAPSEGGPNPLWMVAICLGIAALVVLWPRLARLWDLSES